MKGMVSMIAEDQVSLLASFSILTTLYSDERFNSPYKLLAQFIRFILADNPSLHTVYPFEIKDLLKTTFNFDIPDSVVRKALNGMKELMRNNKGYTIIETDSSEEFQRIKNESVNFSIDIVNGILEYASRKQITPIPTSSDIEDALISLSTDESLDNSKYKNLVAEYVVENGNNNSLQSELNDIRGGSVLYIGLTNDISELGSLKRSLTIYLATEILFDIYGYNGIYFKEMAEDFLDLVKMANKRKKMVRLKIFSDTRKEIDNFFDKAASIIRNHEQRAVHRSAMKMILNKCSDESAVILEKVDFNTCISNAGILDDDEEFDYYTSELNEFNLEDCKLISDYSDTNIDKNKSVMRILSNINKLRKGQNDCTDIESRYIYVTGYYSALKMSEQLVNESKKDGLDYCPANYAIGLNRITNLLWLKLNAGFSKDRFPVNVEMAKKARIVLSSYIANSVEKTFEDAKKQYAAGRMTKEKLISYIIELSKKPEYPEDIHADNLDEDLNFTDEELSRSEHESTKKDNRIRELEEELNSIDEELLRSERESVTKDNRIRELEKELNVTKDNNKNVLFLLESMIKLCFDWLKEKVISIKNEFSIMMIAKLVGKLMIVILVYHLLRGINDFVSFLGSAITIVGLWKRKDKN